MGDVILFLLVGSIMAISPGMIWFFTLGWLFRSADPSELALKCIRYTGIFFVVIGIISIIDNFLIS